ncbi:MAG: MFS transporter [Betaproteobacteria bacterium]|nr:MFS transporter [Betaproteobacteria bacterium]
MTQEEHTPFKTLLLLAFAGFVSGASMRAADPLLPTLAHDFGVRVRDAALVLTSLMFAYGMFQAVHGPLGDRFGKLRIIAIAMLGASAASAGCALSPTLSSLVLFRFLTGMTSGAIIPLSFAFIGDRFSYAGRQAILGRFIAGTLLGQSFGPLVGGILSDTVGWRWTFVVLSAAFFVVAVLVARDIRAVGDRSTGSYTSPWRRYGAMLRSERARPVLGTVALEGFLFYGAFGFCGAYIKQTFALSDSTAGLVVSGFGLGGLAYSLIVGRLVRRLGETGLVMNGGLVLCVCFFAIATLPSAWLIAPFIVALGFGFYMLHNTLQTRATEMAPEARGAAVSFFALCMFLGQAAGVMVFGSIAEWLGYRWPFIVTGALLLVLSLRFRVRLAGLARARAPVS